MAIYLGLIEAHPNVVFKIQGKHQITLAEVREALQYPARAQAAVEDHAEHGWRVIAYGFDLNDREVFAALLPLPEHEGERADTWLCKSARWL